MVDADNSPHQARLAELRNLQTTLGHEFKDLNLLDRALCHSSTGNLGRASYERLEFLGDAILGFVVAEILFSRKPEIPEGCDLKLSIAMGARHRDKVHWFICKSEAELM